MGDIRAVVFDAVGTLIYPHPPVAEVYTALGQRFGSHRTRDEVRKRFRRAFAAEERVDSDDAALVTNEAREWARWRAIVSTTFPEVSEQEELFRALWSHFQDARNWALFDDVAPTWNQLCELGLEVAIASNFDGRLYEICRKLPPLDQESKIFVSAELGYRKPNPRFFESIGQRLGLRGEQILMVGDDFANDYSGARDAGWQAILLRREGPSEQADHLASLAGLPGFVGTPG